MGIYKWYLEAFENQIGNQHQHAASCSS